MLSLANNFFTLKANFHGHELVRYANIMIAFSVSVSVTISLTRYNNMLIPCKYLLRKKQRNSTK